MRLNSSSLFSLVAVCACMAACIDGTIEPGEPRNGNDDGSGGSDPRSPGSGGTNQVGSPGGNSNVPGSAGGSAGSDGTAGEPGSGGGSGSAGQTGSAGSSGSVSCSGTPVLSVKALGTTSIDAMGTPFDTNADDRVGPHDWQSRYGKPPELIAVSSGAELDVLFRDTSSPRRAFVVHVAPSGQGYAITNAFEVTTLGRLMGFTRDGEGSYYYATGVDEDAQVTRENPRPDVYRSNIVRVVKFDTAGCVELEVDVDKAREAKDAGEAIINPMVAASSRLAFGNGRLALVHGINTDPDDGGVRHQKALTTHINASTGAVTRTSSAWVSHSFDQRIFWDGQGFVELHLGDAFPRALAFGRFTDSAGTATYELFRPKGGTGDNTTSTELGSVAPIANGDYGYMVAFSTERAASASSRDVALVRVRKNFASIDSKSGGFIDEATGTVQQVTSSGKTVSNHLRWLTSHDANTHASRARLVAIGGDKFVVLWERWEKASTQFEFNATWGAVIDGDGNVVQAAKQVSTSHISRGDDAVTLGEAALFVTGNRAQKDLILNLVDSALGSKQITLP